MSRRCNGLSVLATNALGMGLQLPRQFYFRKEMTHAGILNVRFVKPKLPHTGQLKKLQRRGFKTCK